MAFANVCCIPYAKSCQIKYLSINSLLSKIKFHLLSWAFFFFRILIYFGLF